MRRSNRRSGAAHSAFSRRLGVAVAVLACLGLVSCAAADTPPPTSTAAGDAVTPLPTDAEVIDAGTHLVTGFTVPFTITVPEGWGSGGWFVSRVVSDCEEVAVNFTVPAYVPTDACAWRGTIVEVGPSPEAFAEAMAAQGSTTTTPAVEITVDGFPGVEFDHSVESDVDISDCDGEKICLHSEKPGECLRYHSWPDSRETYRVLDLNGERAVIAELAVGSVERELIEEAHAVFDSITFVSG